MNQSVRHGIASSDRLYKHTVVDIAPARAIRRAVELNAFLANVPYARYAKHKAQRQRSLQRP